jgi:putative ATPase
METNLFQNEEGPQVPIAAPLASRMRPTGLEEFVGQDHLLSENALLRRLLESDRLVSLILYGPPGTGKTSLAHVIAHMTQSHFETISAVSTGVAEIRRNIDRAGVRLSKKHQRTILFIDEIHRLNKTQQDVLLPHVEAGRIVFIGTTVENPFFYIISPLLSRSHVFELKPLSDEALKQIFQRVVADQERGLGLVKVDIQDDALQFLMDQSEGDARRFLNGLEVVVFNTPPDESGNIRITRDVAETSVSSRILRHDRRGDSHYDIVSAFIKSMRGSDPDATLYWMARMISAGEDPRYIARRIILCAAEDVGNADPQALVVSCAAHTAAQCVGLPEAQIPLAQAALYVATAPKSNACFVGISKAMQDVRSGKTVDVPQHLRSSGFSGAEVLGRGDGYLYPHDSQEGYVHQEYAPGREGYYQPSDRGLEAVIQKRLENLRSTKKTTKEKKK